jgi:hypothetical protein
VEESMKKWFLLPAMVFFVLGTLPAATISFLVIEAGLSEGTERPQSSLLWESGMMDVFFDAGHIVSNAPIMRIPERTAEKLPDPARSEFDEARNGGADYFIMVLLEYPGQGSAGTAGKPEKVYMRIFSVSNETLVYEAACAGGVRLDSNEEFLEVKKNAVKLIPQLRRRG